jgi:ribonuclease P protein component
LSLQPAAVMEKRYRLKDDERFRSVKKDGRSWSDSLLVLCVLPNGLEYSRFGFSVSKRVGKAAVRNRVKRLLRETARLRQAVVSPGRDLVFIARRPIGEASFREVDRSVDRLLRQAGLISG